MIFHLHFRFNFAIVAVAVACSVVALLRQQSGATWMGVLSLGRSYQANDLAEDMKKCYWDPAINLVLLCSLHGETFVVSHARVQVQDTSNLIDQKYPKLIKAPGK